MNVMVVGSGAREHALAWKIASSPKVSNVIVAPGNPGCKEFSEIFDIPVHDFKRLIALAVERDIDLTIVGPEAPLIGGITDFFSARGMRIFGPSASAARIEGSKQWAKKLMERYHIPTAKAKFFEDAHSGIEYSKGLECGSFVIKADGLAAGKGVVLPESHEEAEEVISRGLGDNGRRFLIEERLIGKEVSVFAFVDGSVVSTQAAVCDYKRAYDGDTGGNSGGMGGYAPPEFWTPSLSNEIASSILRPVVTAMQNEGCGYRGILYAGIMVTPCGPKVIEFNCRFGDPECEILMPLMKSDIAEVCMAVCESSFLDVEVDWGEDASLAVVLASGGYPGSYETGKEVQGLNEAAVDDALIFHAGTKFDEKGRIVTGGGRVLVSIGTGTSLATAREKAYKVASRIHFEGAYYRSDIGNRALAQSKSI